MRTLESVFGRMVLMVVLIGSSGGPLLHAGELEEMKQPQEARIYPALRERVVRESEIRDTLIQGEILKAYFEDDVIDSNRVHVDVHDGVVHLSGEVPNRSAVELAERIAGGMTNVVSVVNELEVAEGEGA